MSFLTALEWFRASRVSSSYHHFLILWDFLTAIDLRYRSITSAYYKNATGAIVVYDITKKDTFNSIRNWLNEVKMYADSDLTAIAIGNKIDLEDERQVTTEAGEEFAKEEGVFFMEVSALENADDCVNKAFKLLVEGNKP